MQDETNTVHKKKFSDFAKDSDMRLDGAKVHIDKLLDQEICVLAFRLSKSPKIKGKDLLTIQFKFHEDGERLVTFTNSTVLIRQFQTYATELPFWTVIKKPRNYYCLS